MSEPTFTTYAQLVAEARNRVPEVSCEELSRALKDPDLVLVDVREPSETASGYLPGAILLSRGLLERHAHELIVKKDVRICVCSDRGERAALAAETLQRLGFPKVSALAGGIQRWRHLGLPLAANGATCRLPGGRISWSEVRNEFAIVARRVPVVGSAERPLVYLDHAASTHAPKSVLAAYVEFMEREYANIHRGTHLLSRKATERFDEASHIVAEFIHADLRRGCVVFTLNTTQAIDVASHVMDHRPGKVVTTEMEHHSNELTHRARGPLLRARVDEKGELDLNHLEELLRQNSVKLVAVTAGSNVTGHMPDIHRIARMAHENGALILVDAAQALARLPIDVKDLDDPEHLDFVAGTGHKAYAPFGAGFLYGPRVLMDEAPPYLAGGGNAKQVSAQTAEFLPAPDRHQGGTPNIAGVVGFARALQFLSDIGLAEIRAHELGLTRKLLRGLADIEGTTVYGIPDAARRLGVVSFNVAGVSDLLTAAILSEEGAIAVRNGRFCAHIYVARLLEAQAKRSGSGAEVQPTGAVRASIGLYTDESDIERLLEFVGRVRDRQWKGNYKVKGETVSAEFAGRCADRWMESAPAEQELGPSQAMTDEAILGYEFVSLQPEGECRSYLVADPTTGEAAIVDPLRQQVDRYVELLRTKNYRLRYTIETHTHADHVSGSARLKELTGAAMLMHESATARCVDRGLADGDSVQLGKLKMEVLATPGHTSDAMCLVLPGRVLTGDTLLIGGCGRTDLPTGDTAAMFDSLQRLSALPDDVQVLPAHDYAGRPLSTIGREKETNLRLQFRTADELRAEMAKKKNPPPAAMEEVLSINRECR